MRPSVDFNPRISASNRRFTMTFQPSVRAATLADIPVLHALVESAYRGDSARRGWTHESDLLDGQRTDTEMLAGIIRDESQRILLAFDGDDMIGCVQIARKPGRVSYLGMLTVDPVRQTAGLGKLLIVAAEDLARVEFGAETMEMTVIRGRVELIDYYRRRGYSLTGEERPFPMSDPRFGLPKIDDLSFVVLSKQLCRSA